MDNMTNNDANDKLGRLSYHLGTALARIDELEARLAMAERKGEVTRHATLMAIKFMNRIYTSIRWAFRQLNENGSLNLPEDEALPMYQEYLDELYNFEQLTGRM